MHANDKDLFICSICLLGKTTQVCALLRIIEIKENYWLKGRLKRNRGCSLLCDFFFLNLSDYEVAHHQDGEDKIATNTLKRLKVI